MPPPRRHVEIELRVHADAPRKPANGADCNGCGACCLAGPCPVGIVVSRRLAGACAALLWSDAERRYRCGMVTAPERFVGLRVPVLQRLARRYIAAGAGCDFDAEVVG